MNFPLPSDKLVKLLFRKFFLEKFYHLHHLRLKVCRSKGNKMHKQFLRSKHKLSSIKLSFIDGPERGY